MSNLIKIDSEYKNWIADISIRFRESQLKAAMKVNDEMLRLYWSLGRDISLMSKNSGYGTSFYKSISDDMKDIFPDVKSFSQTNLKYMRYFYEMYPNPLLQLFHPIQVFQKTIQAHGSLLKTTANYVII